MAFNVSQNEWNLNKISLSDPEETGRTVAAYFGDCEDTLLQAFSAGENNSDLKPLAQKLGIDIYQKDENGKYVTDANGNKQVRKLDRTEIQTVAQTRYEKAMRLYSAFSQIMSQANQMLMNVINKIGK